MSQRRPSLSSVQSPTPKPISQENPGQTNPSAPKRSIQAPIAPPKLGTGVFISYRREDSGQAANAIYEALCDRYGSHQVFKDVDSIPAGVDFRQHLARAVDNCAVALVLIGNRWLTAKDDSGRIRLRQHGDFVRIEVEIALSRNRLVIPVLVNNAPMPRIGQVPPSIEPILHRNALQIRYGERFPQDLARVISEVKRALPETNTLSLSSTRLRQQLFRIHRLRSRTWAIILGIGICVLVLLLLWVLAGSKSEDRNANRHTSLPTSSTVPGAQSLRVSMPRRNGEGIPFPS